MSRKIYNFHAFVLDFTPQKTIILRVCSNLEFILRLVNMTLKTFHIKTFGCQMNYADSEKINMILLSAGLRKALDPVKADIIILNTCSVRQKGEDRVF